MNKRQVLERVLPEQVGVSSQGILNFLESVNDKKINLHSFMLLRHGKIAAEGYYKPFDGELLHNVFSVSKSVTSAAVGIAMGEGLLSLGDKVVDFFPEKLGKGVHKYTAMMTIEHLLSMATVHTKSTDTRRDDWVEGFLNTPPDHAPGTIFAYDTTGTHTLCAIIQKVTGMTVHEYLKARLFDPIGMGEIQWESCPMNINKGGSGIKCTTEDLARFGQLYLQKGIWEGKRVLPEGWVERSTARHRDTWNTRMMLDGKNGYGYQFWRTRKNSYCAFGMGGQLVVVMPERDAVFVSTANTLLYRDGQQMLLDSMWETLYPAMAEEMPEKDELACGQLKQRLDTLALVLPEGKNQSPTALRVSGQRFVLEKNPLEYDACEFTFEGPSSRLRFYKGEDSVDICFGMNQWTLGNEPFFGHRSASAATWVDEKTCVVNTQLFDHLQMFILTCRFEEGYLVIHIQPVGVLNTEKMECHLNGSL